jgi:hypothetical protein
MGTAKLITTPLGEELQALAPALASKMAGKRFLGYMNDQKERLLACCGQKDVNRPDLVAKYGFDTKYVATSCGSDSRASSCSRPASLRCPSRNPIVN